MKANAPTRLKRAETERNRYFEVIPPGVPLEAVMSGDYWVHVRKNIRVNDIIEAVAADGSFDAEVRVLSVNQSSGAMTFRLLRKVEGAAGPVAKQTPEDRFEVKHKRFGQYTIVERKTGAVVADGLDKAAAEAEKVRLEAERQAA